MSEKDKSDYGDAITRPFWEAASRHELVVQHCRQCGTYQFYPRPYCLACQTDDWEWAKVGDEATIYSQTTVRIPVLPHLEPPYVVAVVQLDEGPRLVTNIVNGETKIGDRVRLIWRERTDAPPLPVFEPVKGD